MFVAMAAPLTPMAKFFMNKKSRTTFVAEAIKRYSRERFEFPTAFRIPASML